MATIGDYIAGNGDNLSPNLGQLLKMATVAENGDCHRKQRLSQKMATVTGNGNCQSPFSITVAEFGDCSCQCGQGSSHHKAVVINEL